MKLEDYRIFKDLTYDELSDFLEINRSLTYRICKETYCCRLSDAYKINQRTKGYVRLEDLLPEDCS